MQKADADLFITFCALGRVILPEPARTLVLEHCLREGGILAGEDVARAPPPTSSWPPRIRLHAIVVMPDQYAHETSSR